MRISIIGTGYVGLVTGVCLADKGHQVICVDVDRDKVQKINQGIAPIYESGLDELLTRNIAGNLQATTNLYSSVLDTELTMIAVGTPFNGKEIDLTFIKEASSQIGEALRDKSTYHVVVVKSTVVPGTTDEIVLPILEKVSGRKAGVNFGVGMNPEFLTEGVAVQDFMFPDRIVVGGLDQRTIDCIEDVYEKFEKMELIKTNNKTAEMIKYASNALLATMISFSNEIGNLCTTLGGIDVVDVMKGVQNSYYLNPVTADGSRAKAPITSFLEAGCGFGGSCLPKDVKALVSQGQSKGKSMALLDAVIKTNEQQYTQIIDLLKKHFLMLKGIRIGILGLAFKPDTDDMRESPAIPIIKALLADQVEVKAYDPVANNEARKIFGDQITLVDTLTDAIVNVDAIVLVTRWDEFRKVPELLAQLDSQPIFVDGRRMLDKRSITQYEGIGL
jgi:UDPglucose 6-dehydrogenase